MKMLKRTLGILVVGFMMALSASGQKVALKNNLVYDALLTPNAALEVSLSRKWTAELYGGANFFFYERNATAPNYKTHKWSHWLVQPELRYWTCEAFNGLFVGLHGHGGAFNIGKVDIPFVLENKNHVMRNHRYEGYFYGGGLSIGYQLPVASWLNLEASVGAGYARIVYDKFKCETCGTLEGKGEANYVGPTKATLSLVFMLK